MRGDTPASANLVAPMPKKVFVRFASALPALAAAVSFFLGALAAPAAAQDAKATIRLEAGRASYAPGAAAEVVATVAIADGWHVNSNTPTLDFLIPTELALELPAGWPAAAVAYPQQRMMQFPYNDQPIAVYDGTVEMRASFQIPADTLPGVHVVRATFGYQACDDRQCLPPTDAVAEARLTVDAGSGAAAAPDETPTASAPTTTTANATSPSATPASANAAAPPIGLGRLLLLAVLGGLILNAMPCVLPVLSLKIFGLVKSASEGRRHLIGGALATTAGVLVSFWALALLAVLATRAGAAIGWGVQFQEPAFVAFLAVVVVLFSLNMWGLFEIPLPMALAKIGFGGPREGLGGHFFSGLFATLMATPCSAPFLGTAVGFALGQPAPTIFLVFTAVGIGLALPYLALAAYPGFGRLLPKPGDWMITFRNVMGFLLAAAAIWLFYVLAGQISSARLAFVQLALLLLALGAFFLRGAEGRPVRHGAALVVMLAAAFASVYLAAVAPPAAASADGASAYHEWLPFDERQAIELAAQGKVVFVDFTADWCLTCKATERVVIETPEIDEAFERHGVVTMKGDWTNRDDRITSYLARHGRSAVPFYVLFRPGAEPHAFGELLTQANLIAQVESAARVASTLPRGDSGA
jgi:thiol:disulfide interchange protein